MSNYGTFFNPKDKATDDNKPVAASTSVSPAPTAPEHTTGITRADKEAAEKKFISTIVSPLGLNTAALEALLASITEESYTLLDADQKRRLLFDIIFRATPDLVERIQKTLYNFASAEDIAVAIECRKNEIELCRVENIVRKLNELKNDSAAHPQMPSEDRQNLNKLSLAIAKCENVEAALALIKERLGEIDRLPLATRVKRAVNNYEKEILTKTIKFATKNEAPTLNFTHDAVQGLVSDALALKAPAPDAAPASRGPSTR